MVADDRECVRQLEVEKRRNLDEELGFPGIHGLQLGGAAVRFEAALEPESRRQPVGTPSRVVFEKQAYFGRRPVDHGSDLSGAYDGSREGGCQRLCQPLGGETRERGGHGNDGCDSAHARERGCSVRVLRSYAGFESFPVASRGSGSASIAT